MAQTPALPVEIRDSLSSISTFVAAIGNSSQNTTTIYDAPSVALVGSTGDGADAASTLFTAKFQALPFSDPATGLVYARARWYSPETGTFLRWATRSQCARHNSRVRCTLRC